MTQAGTCSGQESGAGVSKHVLDNFAVCCRNVATCVVNVASHYVVGKVRLQNNVLGVHVHLENKNGDRGRVRKLQPTLSLPKKVVGSGEADRHRGDREGDKEVETDVRDKDLEQRDKDGREGIVMVQENTNCLHKRKSETSPESEPIP